MGSGVNYLAILVAAVAAWVFGGVYYHALADRWLAAIGKTKEQFQAERAAAAGALAKARPFLISFAAELLMAWVLYGVLVHLKTFSLRAGLITGAFCWLGFVATTLLVNNTFAGRKGALTAIDAGHWLGALLIMGAILGVMGG